DGVSSAGVIWVAEHDGSIVRIDLRTNRIVGGPTRIRAPAPAIAADPGGIWVASGVSGTLTRLDPSTGKVLGSLTFTRPLSHGVSINTSLIAAQGSIW